VGLTIPFIDNIYNVAETLSRDAVVLQETRTSQMQRSALGHFYDHLRASPFVWEQSRTRSIITMATWILVPVAFGLEEEFAVNKGDGNLVKHARELDADG